MNILVNEVCKPGLFEQVVLDGEPLIPALSDLSGLAVEFQYSLFDFVQRPDAGVDTL